MKFVCLCRPQSKCVPHDQQIGVVWLRSPVLQRHLWNGTKYAMVHDVHGQKLRDAQDRVLVAELTHPQLHIGIAVLHAPSSDDKEELQRWWKQVDQQLRPIKNVPMFVLMDANSRVGTINSRCIGRHDAAEENCGGECMHQWLERNSLWLPLSVGVPPLFGAQMHSWQPNTASLQYVLLSQLQIIHGTPQSGSSGQLDGVFLVIQRHQWLSRCTAWRSLPF